MFLIITAIGCLRSILISKKRKRERGLMIRTDKVCGDETDPRSVRLESRGCTGVSVAKKQVITNKNTENTAKVS